MVQNKFGLNNNPKSFRVLRTERDSADIPTPKDPRLAELAQTLHLVGPLAPATPTELKKPGSATDLVGQGVVGINRLLGKVQSVGAQIRKPLNDIANASRQAGRAVRDVQGIIQQGALIKQDFNNAIGEARKLTDMLGITEPQIDPYDLPLDKLTVSRIESNQLFNRDRIAWSLTTQADVLLGNKPIQFFVNPSKVNFSSDYLEVLEFVQSGNFYTRWKSAKDNRAFPNLKLGFTFQSSNILPETYADRQTSVQETRLDEGPDGKFLESGMFLKRTYTSSSKYVIPPGIENFYDILDILNAPTTIDVTTMDTLSTETKQLWDGQPNFVILRLSTRTFPLMTCKGFFMQGWSLDESAENPLAFDIPLKFVAFESDPPWWDRSQIMDRYNDIYRNAIVTGDASTLADSINSSNDIQGLMADIKKSSQIDSKTLENAAQDQGGSSEPAKDAPDPGAALTNMPAKGFGSDVEAQVAIGSLSLKDLSKTDSRSTYNVAPVGTSVQTALQLSNGNNYIRYQKPDGSSQTSFNPGSGPGLSQAWTSYVSATAPDGTRTYTATNAAGQQILSSQH
jgi:hypothetical protein